MKKLITIFFLGFVSITYAQSTGSIVGKLTDKDYNDEPLSFANVFIKGTSKGTTSDFDGLYELANLEPGTYTVVYSFVGYETIEMPNVTVEANKVTTINVPMGASAAALDEIAAKTAADGYKIHTLIREVVLSEPFLSKSSPKSETAGTGTEK